MGKYSEYIPHCDHCQEKSIAWLHWMWGSAYVCQGCGKQMMDGAESLGLFMIDSPPWHEEMLNAGG